MIKLAFKHSNCDEHNVAEWLNSQISDEVVTLSALLALRNDIFDDDLDEDLITRVFIEYGVADLSNPEVFLTAFCRKFTDSDVLIIVPDFCKKAALRCCSQMHHVKCVNE